MITLTWGRFLRAVCTQDPVWIGEFKHGRLFLCFCVKAVPAALPSDCLTLTWSQARVQKENRTVGKALLQNSGQGRLTLLLSQTSPEGQLNNTVCVLSVFGQEIHLCSAQRLPFPPHTYTFLQCDCSCSRMPTYTCCHRHFVFSSPLPTGT